MILANVIKQYPELSQLNYKETAISEILGEIGLALKIDADLKFASIDEYSNMEVIEADEDYYEKGLGKEQGLSVRVKQDKETKEWYWEIIETDEYQSGFDTRKQAYDDVKRRLEGSISSSVKSKYKKQMENKTDEQRKDELAKLEEALLTHDIDKELYKEKIKVLKKMLTPAEVEQVQDEVEEKVGEEVEEEIAAGKIEAKYFNINVLDDKDIFVKAEDNDQALEIAFSKGMLTEVGAEQKDINFIQEVSKEEYNTKKIDIHSKIEAKKEKKEEKKEDKADKKIDKAVEEITEVDKKDCENYIPLRETYDAEDKAKKRVTSLEKKGYKVVHFTKLTKVVGTERKEMWEIEAQMPIVPKEDTKLENEESKKLELVDAKRGTEAGDKIKPMGIGDIAKKMKPLAINDVSKSVKPTSKDGKSAEVKQIAIKSAEEVESSEKIEAMPMANGNAISKFLDGTFPKKNDWGSNHLFVREENGHWGLMNYSTFLLFRVAGEVYFNTDKYSVTTSKIQSQIRSEARMQGITLNECTEADLQQIIDSIPSEEPEQLEAPAETKLLESSIKVESAVDFVQLTPEQQQKCIANFLTQSSLTVDDFGTEENLRRVLAKTYDWNAESCEPIMYDGEQKDMSEKMYGFDIFSFAEAYYELRENEPNDLSKWDIFKTKLGYAVYKKGKHDRESFAGDFSAMDMDNYFAPGWENGITSEVEPVAASSVKVETGSPTTVEVKVENNQLDIKVGTTEIKTPAEGNSNIVINETTPGLSTTVIDPNMPVPTAEPLPVDTTVEAPSEIPAEPSMSLEEKKEKMGNEINSLLAEYYSYDDSPTGKIVKAKIQAKIVEIEASIKGLSITASKIEAEEPNKTIDAPTNEQIGQEVAPEDTVEPTEDVPVEDKTTDAGIEIGEGHIAHVDEETNEVYVLNENGEEVLRVFNSFTGDPEGMAKTFRGILNISEPQAEVPVDETAPGEPASIEQKIDEVNKKLDELINIKKNVSKENVGEGEESQEAGEGDDRDEKNDEELSVLKKEIQQKKQQVDKILTSLSNSGKLVISRDEIKAQIVAGEDAIFAKKRAKQLKLKALAKKFFAMDTDTLNLLQASFINNVEIKDIKNEKVSSILMFLND